MQNVLEVDILKDSAGELMANVGINQACIVAFKDLMLGSRESFNLEIVP